MVGWGVPGDDPTTGEPQVSRRTPARACRETCRSDARGVGGATGHPPARPGECARLGPRQSLRPSGRYGRPAVSLSLWLSGWALLPAVGRRSAGLAVGGEVAPSPPTAVAADPPVSTSRSFALGPGSVVVPIRTAGQGLRRPCQAGRRTFGMAPCVSGLRRQPRSWRGTHQTVWRPGVRGARIPVNNRGEHPVGSSRFAWTPPSSAREEHRMAHDMAGGLTGWDLEGLHSGGDTECWRRLGSHVVTVTDDERGEIRGTRFAVWAPNARSVRVEW